MGSWVDGRCLDRERKLYTLARKRARWGQLWSSLTGRSHGLLDLKQIKAACAIQAQTSGGIRTIPINEIRGSEGRSRYFDRDYSPLHDRAQGRWLNIARARQRGKDLPPVVLVQVGEVYFVADGHHRISVARALGQSEIEARVTIWQVTGPLPWETPESTASRGLLVRLHATVRALTQRPAYEERGFLGLATTLRSASGPATGG